MQRRQFVRLLAAAVVPTFLRPSLVIAATRKFVFKIKTKSGSIIGNIVIEATDMENAKYKLRKRYPDCEILESKAG
jgi:hypothetical protein